MPCWLHRFYVCGLGRAISLCNLPEHRGSGPPHSSQGQGQPHWEGHTRPVRLLRPPEGPEPDHPHPGHPGALAWAGQRHLPGTAPAEPLPRTLSWELSSAGLYPEPDYTGERHTRLGISQNTASRLCPQQSVCGAAGQRSFSAMTGGDLDVQQAE